MVGQGRTVFIYTGILPIMATQSGAAMVIGHELSHCLAGHASDGLILTAPLAWLAAPLLGMFGSYVC